MSNSTNMARHFLYAITLFYGFTLLVGCNDTNQTKSTADKESQPAFDMAAARKQIDSANLHFMDLVSKGDSVGLANCYTTDAKMMGPNEPATVGRKNIQAAIAGMVNAGIGRVNLTTVDLWGDEAMLVEEGVLTLDAKDGKQIDKGKYIVLWKKEDGSWKLFRDFFNSDLPVPSK